MCNLSDRIEQQRIQKGEIEAVIGLVAKRPEFTIEQALEIFGITFKQYQDYLEHNQL